MEFDTVIIDPMSNSAYLGTDEDGLPIPAEKSDEDGRYYLYGDLQLAPPSAFKNALKNMEKMLVYVGNAKSSSSSPYPDMCSLAAAQTQNTCRTACPTNSPPSSPAPKNASVMRQTWEKEPERLGY